MSSGECDVCGRRMTLRLHHLTTADDGAVAACCGPECAKQWVLECAVETGWVTDAEAREAFGLDREDAT